MENYHPIDTDFTNYSDKFPCDEIERKIERNRRRRERRRCRSLQAYAQELASIIIPRDPDVAAGTQLASSLLPPPPSPSSTSSLIEHRDSLKSVGSDSPYYANNRSFCSSIDDPPVLTLLELIDSVLLKSYIYIDRNPRVVRSFLCTGVKDEMIRRKFVLLRQRKSEGFSWLSSSSSSSLSLESAELSQQLSQQQLSQQHMLSMWLM